MKTKGNTVHSHIPVIHASITLKQPEQTIPNYQNPQEWHLDGSLLNMLCDKAGNEKQKYCTFNISSLL